MLKKKINFVLLDYPFLILKRSYFLKLKVKFFWNNPAFIKPFPAYSIITLAKMVFHQKLQAGKNILSQSNLFVLTDIILHMVVELHNLFVIWNIKIQIFIHYLWKLSGVKKRSFKKV